MQDFKYTYLKPDLSLHIPNMANTKQNARHASARGSLSEKVPRRVTVVGAPPSVRRFYCLRPGTRDLIEIRKGQSRTYRF